VSRSSRNTSETVTGVATAGVPVRRRAAAATFVGHAATVTLTVLQAFFLLPLSLSVLGAPVLGAWLAASEVLVWIQLLDLGIPHLLAQRVAAAAGEQDFDRAAGWSATGMALLAGVALLLALVGMLGAPLVVSWIGVPDAHRAEFGRAFALAVVASALILVFNGLQGVARGVQRPALMQSAQVGGVAVGLVTSIVLLWNGWGILALAVGLLTRAAVSVAGALIFLSSLPGRWRWVGRPARHYLRETRQFGGAMALGSSAHVLAQNTEVLIVAIIFGPVPAAVYGLTRRAIDGVRNLLDGFVLAIPPGLAHLIGARDRERASSLAVEALWLHLAAACVSAAIVVAVNSAFVSLLFEPSSFGGTWLTCAFAVQLILSSRTLLLNSLLRATGDIALSGRLMFLESVGRVFAVPAGLLTAGLAGAPWAGAAVSAGVSLLSQRRLFAALPGDHQSPHERWSGAVPVVFLLAAAAGTLFWTPRTWGELALTALGVSVCGAGVLWPALPAAFRPAWNRAIVR